MSTSPDRSLTETFHRLTPEQVLGAVEVGGRRCTGRFQTLNSYENRVYQLEVEDGSWVVGKFYRPGRWSREAIAQEFSFLDELHGAGVPVVPPMELEDGRRLGEVVGILFALFPFVRGRVPQELDDTQLRELGKLLALMHKVGGRQDAPLRRRLTPATYGMDNLRSLMEHEMLPPEVRDGYRATVEALMMRVEPMFLGVPVHRIHGDCHLANLVFASSGPRFLDFDDMLVGPAVQDVWMLAPSADREGKRQREVLLQGYEQVKAFDRRWLRLVEPLRALRFIHYATWIAQRWGDPAFQRAFSNYGTLAWWQAEMMDLREQIARIDEDRDT